MNYREAIDFLYSSLPMYQREGKAAYKANLDNTLRLDTYFGHPHRQFPAVHVAGTNGKGSVSHLLASVLQQSGYRTGLYTSPHLLDFRERIRIDGVPVPRRVVTGFVNDHREVIGEISPSFFEMTVAMAFDHFAGQKVDVAVIETGMGGRLDSTNIITPVLSVITNISPDHTEFLGTTLPSIAMEKGGIIKPGVPVVLGPSAGESVEVLLSIAREKGAPVTLATEHYEPLYRTFNREGESLYRIRRVKDGSVETWKCGLAGDYQKENLITTLSIVDLLRESDWELPRGSVEKGFSTVVEGTGIMGRWQTLGSNPRSICDTAHNIAGITAVMEQLRQIPRKELHVVWGMVSDKDSGSILPLLPREASYYFARSSVPRSMDPQLLLENAKRLGLQGSAFPTVREAYRAAKKKTGPDDMIFTGGSTFVVADLLKALGY